MRRFILVILILLSGAYAVAQEATPDARFVMSRDVDYPGGDLAVIFDTTLDACQNACLATTQCTAFTFNQRSSTCFPKVDTGTVEPYAGAISGRVIRTPAQVASLAANRLADLGFLADSDIAAALDLAVRLGRLHAADELSAEALLTAAEQARAKGDGLGAWRFTGAALSITDRSDHWLEYGRLARSVTGESSDEVNAARRNALPATINAYLRSDSAAAQATVLAELAISLEATERGRLMIPALRLAQQVSPRRDAEAALERAIGLYGFRVADTDVQSDSATPRICVIFSEPLVQVGVDYATYVQVPDPRLAISVEGAQLCVDGVVHGERYRLVMRDGLPSQTGETLDRPVELTLYVRDRTPRVRFVSRAYVLPRLGDIAVPLESVNLDSVDLSLARVSDRNILRTIQEDLFASPLYAWQQEYFTDQIGEAFWQGTAQVQGEINQDGLTRLPLTEALSGQPAGVYVLSASVPGADPFDTPPATQWFILSDMGLATMQGVDGLTVVVRSLADAAAVSGAEVQLVSRANAVLGTTQTDVMGVARFAPGLTRGTGASAAGLVTVRHGADDLAFLSLTDPAFDLSDRGVEGREPAPPIDVFLTTDRGAYRAGETIWATALMRDAQARALPGVPLTAILIRPDGVEYSRISSAQDSAGGHVFALSTAGTAPRGTWRIEVRADVDAAPLARATVLVEDFLPERIDFHMVAEPFLRLGQPSAITVAANYLFGPPAPDLPIEGEVLLRAAADLTGFEGYTFGRHDERFEAQLTGIAGDVRTDSDGGAVVALEFLEVPGGASQPLEAIATLRLAEASGRPVERRLTVPVRPDMAMIGLRPASSGVLPEGGTARFGLIGLAPDLTPQGMQVQWTINRLNTTYQWYQLFGDWNWEPVTTRTRIASGTATLGIAPVEVSAPVEWGQYEIVVERTDGAYIASSATFNAGWYALADAETTPDLLEASLDAQSYALGDTAAFRIVPRYAGTAIITVMTNRVVSMQAVDVIEGENLIGLRVTEEWGAGAYVSASVIRPMDVSQDRNPARALGLAYAPVAPGDKQLELNLGWNENVAPRGPITVSLAVAGAGDGPAFVTLAAVDVGILNITGFDSPDPSGHYFGQRKLGIELRDIYGRLIDGMNGAMGAVRSGGDAQADMGGQAPPPTEELVAYFSGPVPIGPDGTAELTFDLPSFNGTVRLMAVAWSGQAVGQAEAEVLVRDPVVVTASVPRFLAPGDSSRMLLEFVHADGPPGTVQMQVAADGLLLSAQALPASFNLTEGGKQIFRVPFTANGVGNHEITVALTTPDGSVLEKTLTIPVVLNDPEVVRTSRFTLEPGATFTFDNQVFAGFATGSGSATLSIGPLARFDAPGLLEALNRYPYGCTEQITSRALPLLYFGQVAQAMSLAGGDEIEQRIARAVQAVLGNQAANGAFGMWGPNSGDLWLDAYVTDFLSRARTRGHTVPDLAFEAAMNNLSNRVNYAPDFEAGGQDIAYALMVLAREGAAAIGDLRYYVDERADAFTTPLAAAQMGAALAFYGDQQRADTMFRRAAAQLAPIPDDIGASVWRTDYGTVRRDNAAVLALAVEAGSDVVDTDLLSSRLAGAGGRISTQEAAWTLLAADALVDDMRQSGLTINGVAPDGPLVRMRAAAAPAVPVNVANTGSTPTELTVTTFGVPSRPEPAGGNGYTIERSYYTMEGEAVSPDGVAVGTRLVAVLTVRPFGQQEARLMVNDPLPAGFEIDNPNLLRGGDIRALDWLDPVRGENAEFRRDRFLAAVDWRSDSAFQLAYIVRAVSPGSFRHPAASVEDMYRPQMRANTATGQITVVE